MILIANGRAVQLNVVIKLDSQILSSARSGPCEKSRGIGFRSLA
jgi:hypothetical protein